MMHTFADHEKANLGRARRRPVLLLAIFVVAALGVAVGIGRSHILRRVTSDAWNGASPEEILAVPAAGGGPPKAGPAHATDPRAAAFVQDFRKDVLPIFQARCVSCHGPDKKKGGLRLDRPEDIFRGDPREWPVIPGKSADSALVKRLLLPEEDEDHMPAKAPTLAEEEIAAIRRWIDAGAPWKKTPLTIEVEAAAPPAPVAAPVEAPFSPNPRVRHAIDQIAAAGGRVSPLAEKSGMLDANLSFVGEDRLPEALAALAAIGPNVLDVSLARTHVTDAQLAILGECAALERLHLESTPVSDEGLGHLTNLKRLEYLNLHSTAITDEGLRILSPMASLRRLFLWGTRVTPVGVEEIRHANAALEVELGLAAATGTGR